MADLTEADGYPCISVLLPTGPAPRMTAGDREQLQRLVAEVDRELLENAVAGRNRLMRRLSALVDKVSGQPTDRALALYTSLAVDRAFRLPLPVTPRAVVERTFATRPLLDVLHRMPPHVLLVLHPACAHLYQGADGGLRSVGREDHFRDSNAVRLPRAGDPGAGEVAAELVDGYLRAVDRLLGEYRADHPSPLVLGGAPHLVDRFCVLSRNLDRLAGRIPPQAAESALDLARASAETVADVACGMAACWRAVHERSPSMFLVEEDYVSPGRPDAGMPTRPSRQDTRAVHDLVDDQMEVAIMRGGQLALVANGDLAEHGRVALICRKR